MFNNLGLPELLMLLLLGLIVFGPDQLPKIAGDLGRMIRQLRQMAKDASSDLRSELGPEFDDLASLNPRSFIKKHVLGDDDLPGTSSTRPVTRRATPSPAKGDAVAVVPTAEAAPAPYDADAT